MGCQCLEKEDTVLYHDNHRFRVKLTAFDMLGTSKAYDPVSLDNVSTFGFRGEGEIFIPH